MKATYKIQKLSVNSEHSEDVERVSLYSEGPQDTEILLWMVQLHSDGVLTSALHDAFALRKKANP